jgi:hypothetical protein
MRQQRRLRLPVGRVRLRASARRSGRRAPRPDAAGAGGPDPPGRGRKSAPLAPGGGLGADPAHPAEAGPATEEPIRHGPPGSIDEDLRWTAATPEQPCPICGATAGCGVAADDGFVACEGVPSEHPLDVGGWLHRLPRPTAG